MTEQECKSCCMCSGAQVDLVGAVVTVYTHRLDNGREPLTHFRGPTQTLVLGQACGGDQTLDVVPCFLLHALSCIMPTPDT
jgi:hypothetical protein